MAASTIQNPAAHPESKSSKKKKSKIDTSATPVATTPVTEPASSIETETANGDGAYESPYIKELYKSIRNVNKKITNASKVDNILAENPDKSLDELVKSRKINNDQKAQILKKPALQSSLTQLEEQISQYKKFDQEYKSKAQAEKAEFEKSFSELAEKNLSEALAAAKAEAAATAAKEQQDSLLVLSQFLRLAAARRGDEETDATSDENMALEGVLLQVYTGDETAVAAMIKLINGVDAPTFATNGEQLATTYANVKAAAIAQAPSVNTIEEDVAELTEASAVETAEYPVQGDPTIVNAGMTELDDVATVPVINGHSSGAAETAAAGIPQNSGIDEGAANEVAESHWGAAKDISESQEWIEVPRDVTETDTGIAATPAAAQAEQPTTTSSWADETTNASVPVVANDGFQEVNGRSRGREGQNRGRGGGRGGPKGGFRGNGEGHRGNRGRGGPRGGAPREGGAQRQQQRQSGES